MKNIFFRIFVITFLFLSAFILNAQDLIILTNKDSINCRIEKIKGDNIYFSYKNDTGIINTQLLLDEISFFEYDYYTKSHIHYYKNVNKTTSYPKLRIAPKFGYSQRIGKLSEDISPELIDYHRKLLVGYNYGLDVKYFNSEFTALGICYSNFRTKNKTDVEVNFYNDTYFFQMSDDIQIHYLGLTLSALFIDKIKYNSLLLSISLGKMVYQDNFIFLSNYNVTGNSLGGAFDISYDYKLSNYLSFGMQLTYLTGKINVFYVDYGYKSETKYLDGYMFESVSRLDFSVGLRFKL